MIIRMSRDNSPVSLYHFLPSRGFSLTAPVVTAWRSCKCNKCTKWSQKMSRITLTSIFLTKQKNTIQHLQILAKCIYLFIFVLLSLRPLLRQTLPFWCWCRWELHTVAGNTTDEKTVRGELRIVKLKDMKKQTKSRKYANRACRKCRIFTTRRSFPITSSHFIWFLLYKI